jgi:hypothetical protein
MKTKLLKNKEGWVRPLFSKKFHYFTLDGMALCKKWMLFPEEVDTGDPTIKTHDSCVACHRKLMALETKQPKY